MATTQTNEDALPKGKLKKTITTALLFFFILGDILGAGIYTLVGTLAADVGGALWLPLLIALVLALLTAGTFAELITKYPHASGTARAAQRAFNNPYLTFLSGYLMLAAGITTAAALANAFSRDYLAAVIPGVPPVPVAIAFIGLIVLVLLWGVKESLMANVGASIIELSGLIIIIVVAGLVIAGGNADVTRWGTFAEGVPIVDGAFAATITAFFSFLGFQAAANMAEEVKDPTRSYPKALFGAILVAAVVYMGVALGAAAVVPTDVLAESSGPLLEVIRFSGFDFPIWIFGIIALIAIGNGALLFMMMSSRAIYGLAEAKLLPKVFDRVLAGRKTPWVAIVATGVVTTIMLFAGDIGLLADTSVLLLLLVFVGAHLSIIILRNDKVDHKYFRVPKIVPILAMIFSLALMTQQDPMSWLITAGYLVVGTILFFISRYMRKRDYERGTAEQTGLLTLE